jgi:hypothetical protein
LKPKLSEIASIAEVVGAVAIVISLIYVGIQVNESTRAVRSATASETSSAISSWYAELGGSLQASQVFLDGLTDPDSLSREEKAQFIYLVHGLQLQYQYAFYLAQEQTLEVRLQESLTNTMLGVREQPGFIMYWQQRRELFAQDFRAYVDEIIATGITNDNVEQLYQDRDPE